MFKVVYEAKLEFPVGWWWGFKPKEHLGVRGVGIFSGTTQCMNKIEAIRFWMGYQLHVYESIGAL